MPHLSPPQLGRHAERESYLHIVFAKSVLHDRQCSRTECLSLGGTLLSALDINARSKKLRGQVRARQLTLIEFTTGHAHVVDRS